MRNIKVANDVTATDQAQGDAVERPAFPQALLLKLKGSSNSRGQV